MIETRHLRYIITTAEHGSFSQAALVLRMKQSTLSQRIRHLEDSLGVDLFDRTTRGARLTKAGQHFLVGARQVVADLDQMHDKASAYGSGAGGHLAIGISGAVPPTRTQAIFLGFNRLHPRVGVTAVIGDRKNLTAQLARRQADAIFIAGHLAPQGAKYVSIGSDRLFAVVHRGSTLAGMEFLHWADLRTSDILMPSGDLGDDLIGQIASRLPLTGDRPAFARHPLGYDALPLLIGPSACTIISEPMIGQIPSSHAVVPIHEVHGYARLDYGVCWQRGNENPALRNFLSLIGFEALRPRVVDVSQTPDRQP
ncbi:LysR family transcriptional regulator [Sphingobium sp.]|uniref:LysR family transcriptional regulator n=1 Tax=Sphingobium sp. TaxID=1912891 RepID=UPI003B3A9605